MVPVLTGAGNGPAHAGRMPRADARHLAETAMCLAGQLGDTPTSNDALKTLSAGDADAVDHLVLGEDGVHGNGLLEVLVGEVNLLGNVLATIDLDLHHVRLLLLQVLHLAHLRVGDDADHVGVLAQHVQVPLDGAVLVLLGVLGERLLLGLEPVLVEAALDLVVEVLSPHGVERTQACGSTHVANAANDNHCGSLNEGHRLEGLLLVELGAGLVHIAHDMGHANLEAKERGEVRRLGGVIAGKLLALAASALGALLGQKPKMAAAGMFELAVRHLDSASDSLIRVGDRGFTEE
mmetsp:Transcript_15710/g.38130  ORF Transcript_15710/g.38130 Transcript_15710/m.38130 type:complete len:293 (+) Transcript_15710:1847-2725(+)